ncbi:Isochorismatase-like protein [Aspergillus foveolatus]|uniref:Isochorismatase-like protein n=1 Tax=Aspergillus foveolatus TaxID=210207 RepID=UPI003CCCB174
MTFSYTPLTRHTQGQTFISNCKQWNDAIHKLHDRPLTIFTSLSFNPNEPEVQPDSPFAKLIAPCDKLTAGSHRAQIYKRFQIDKSDIVLQKTRWSATSGSSLVEQILRAKGIKSVVVSGLSLSGVVLATVYTLFDLDYNVYVIRDNVLELPVEQTGEVAHVMMDILLPKVALSVISLEEAIEALRRS